MRELNLTSLTPELEREVDLGDEHTFGGFAVRMADSPLAFPVADLFDELKQPIITSLYEQFSVWIVPHRISIQRRSGLAEPTSVGIQVEYKNGQKTCAIAGLLPSSQFHVFGKTNVNFEAKGKMSASGDTLPLSNSGKRTEEPKQLALRGGLEFGASSDANLTFGFRSVVVSPTIAATGVGSSSCEWRFDKDEESLFGRDIETWSILVLPKLQTTLKYQMRFYMNFRTLFFPTRVQSPWEKLTCQLVSRRPLK